MEDYFKVKNISLFKVYMPAKVEDRLKVVLHSGYVAEGEEVRAFENHLQKFLGNKNVMTTNSCTSAIHLALKMCDVEPNNYVLTSPMTCLATNVSIQNMGASAVWVDVDARHGMMTPESLSQALADFRQARVLRGMPAAVIYVCWGGDLGSIREIDAICREAKIKLIIDAAQAFGCEYQPDGKKLGNGEFGDYVCFSFQAIKHITTGDGGAMVLRDSDEYKRASILKWFGIDREGFKTPSGEINWKADVSEIGFKFHMNNIAGCIGCSQMEDRTFKIRLEEYRRKDLILREGLKGVLERSWIGPSASWVATFLYDRSIELLEFLREKNIHASQMHVNNDIYSGFRGAIEVSTGLSGTKSFMERHICLPCGWWVSDEEISYIIESIKEFERG